MIELGGILKDNAFARLAGLLLSVIVSLWLTDLPLHSKGLLPTTSISVCQNGPPQCDYQTIQDASDAANDGDTILVYPGVYEGRVILGNKVTLKSSDGPQVTTIIAAEGPIVTAGDILSATVQGFTIDGQDTLTNVIGIESINCDLIVSNCIVKNLHGASRPDADAIAIRSTGMGSLIVTGTTIQNIIGSIDFNSTGTRGNAVGIWIEGEAQANITETTIERLIGGAKLPPWGDVPAGYAVGVRAQGVDLTISDSKIAEVLGGENWDRPAQWCPVCPELNSPSIGVEVTGGSLILHDSVFTSFPFEPRVSIYALLVNDTSDMVLERNVIAPLPTAAEYGELYTVASSLPTAPCPPCSPVSSNVVAVRAANGLRLHASGNSIDNLHLPGAGKAVGMSLYWVDEVVLSRNLIANVSSEGGKAVSGIRIETADVASIDSNTVRAVRGDDAVGISLVNVAEAVVANNVIQSITGSQGDDATGLFISEGAATVQNNTLYQTIPGLVGPDGQPGKAIGLRVAGSASVQATNNVLAGHGAGVSAVLTYTLLSDYNDFWDNEVDYEGVSPGANDLHADPSFVDAQNGDLHLTSSSPLIDAGISAVVVSEDFEKDPRPLDGDDDGDAAIDIGADEYWSGLYGSTKTVNRAIATSSDVLTYQLTLVNPSSRYDRIGVTMTDTVPSETFYVEGSLVGTAGTWGYTDRVITWTGAISAGERVTLTFDVTIAESLGPCAIMNRAVLDDQIGKVQTLEATTLVDPLKRYLPFVFQSFP